MTNEPTLADAIERRKFYHHEWPISKLLEARNGGLVTDAEEAWFYEFTSKDGTGGKFDMLYRHSYAPADDKDATIARLAEQVNTLITEKSADAEAIGALEAKSNRLSRINSGLCGDFNAMNLHCARLETKLAEVTAERDAAEARYTTACRTIETFAQRAERAEAKLAEVTTERDKARHWQKRHAKDAREAGTFAQGIEAAAMVADDHTPAKHGGGTLAAHVTGATIARAIRALAGEQP